MPFLKPYLLKYRGKIFLGQFFKLVEAVLELLIPLVMAALIDGGVRANRPDVIWSKAGEMVLLSLVGIACALVCQVVATRASVDFGQEMRHDVFEKITSLSLQDLDQVGTGSLLMRVTGDVQNLQDGLAMLIRLVVRAPFLAVGSIVMAVSLNLSLSIVFLVVTPLIVTAMWAVLRLTAPRFKHLQAMLDALSLTVREGLTGTRVIRAFSRERAQAGRVREKARKYREEAEKVGRLSALLSPATSLIMNLGIAAVVLVGARRVAAGDLQVGIIIAFIEYLAQILLQTAVVANLVMLYTKAYASARRVEELMETVPSVRGEGGISPAAADGEILRLNGAGLCYPDGKRALQDISFTLKQGETLGVIGGTGSGKTSLLRLILRLYDATEGTVMLGGRNVREISPDAARALAAVVPQQAKLMRGSIRDNLLPDGAPMDDERLWAALSMAQADFVLKLDGGLDFVVEENGRNLSGGQRQRITIARALLRPARLLVLDDAFSALDFATEAAVRRALGAGKNGRAQVIVSQRASSIMRADKILVLDEGKQAGLGTHEELMRACPVYKEIWRSQQPESEAAR